MLLPQPKQTPNSWEKNIEKDMLSESHGIAKIIIHFVPLARSLFSSEQTIHL